MINSDCTKSVQCKVFVYCSGFPDYIPGEANAEAQGGGFWELGR